MMDFVTTDLTDPNGLQLRWSNCHPVQTARVETISQFTLAFATNRGLASPRLHLKHIAADIAKKWLPWRQEQLTLDTIY